MRVHIVTAWQRWLMYPGDKFSTGERSYKTHSPININEGLEGTRTHSMELMAGDCIYIPAYWWYQLEISDDSNTLVVTHWYDVASTWLKMLMTGIENDIL